MPSAAEAAAFGLTLEEASGPPVDIWPDNLNSFNAFVALLSQWRFATGGATGLDYAVIPTVLRLINIPRPAWAGVFDDLRVMEDAALEQMRKNRKEAS